MAELDSLFNSGGLDSKLDFLTDKGSKKTDGLYRIDLNLVKDKKKGWRSVVRLLPNLTKEGLVGDPGIEKITHFVDIKNNKDLSGYFDSPRNFKEDCPLSKLFFQMKNSKNAVLEEKAKCLQFNKKYYSYCLVIEDEQQPELIGRIMILQYGKQILDKIVAEKDGTITGEKCTVFDISTGKDLVLIAKETTGPDGKVVPEYNSSAFRGSSSSISLWNKDKKSFKNVPLIDGNIDPKYRTTVKEFLLDREYELESFAPQRLTETQLNKINNITNYLLGQNSMGGSKPSANDFDFEEITTASPSSTSKSKINDDADFFADFN